MKKATKELLLTVIKSYQKSNEDDLNKVMLGYDFGLFLDDAHYCICLKKFTVVEDIEKMTKEEFTTHFSTFESWQLVKEWLKESDNWEDDILLLAKQNGLEEGVDEVIALLK